MCLRVLTYFYRLYEQLFLNTDSENIGTNELGQLKINSTLFLVFYR